MARLRGTGRRLGGAAARGVMRPLRYVLRNGKRVRVNVRVPKHVPPGVKRLPSGRYPANYRYAGRVYDGPEWTRELQAKYPNGVRFTKEGFPDFSPYALRTVTIEPRFAGNRTTDFIKANELATKPIPEGCIWHHCEDLQTLQLVPVDLHSAIRHAGGCALMKGRI
jgi:hypothetical protein